MIKGRENKAQSTDFLVCFPSRAHLTLMPKPVCSPNRPSEPNKRHNHHLKRINTRASGAGNGGPNSPLMWAKNNQMRRQEVAEPTSPKVTCAGQIKVRPSSSTASKSWQSVMEEIERIHNRGKDKKKPKWAESFGFKKDVTNFLTCLRNVRFDFRCFGAFPQADIVTSDDEDDEEEEEFDDDEFDICEENHHLGNNNNTTISDDNNSNNNNAVFSKWFMVLQENNNDHVNNDLKLVHEDVITEDHNKGGDEDDAPAVPPPNALLLMRCRSAPAKSWLEEKEIEDKEEKLLAEEEVVKQQEEEKKDKKKRESLAILMKYDTDFYNLSSEIAQETWVVGGLKDAFSRSRSWRR